MYHRLFSIVFMVSLLLIGCRQPRTELFRTTGTVEAYQVDIRASGGGKLIYSNIREGTAVKVGHLFSVIDTTAFHLQKEALYTKINGITLQIQSLAHKRAQLESRLAYLNKQHQRLSSLAASDGVSQDKVDEITMERDVVRSQLADIPVSRENFENSIQQMRDQIAQLNYHIGESRITAPASGMLLKRYVNPGERVQPGYLLATLGLTDTVWVMMYLPEPMLSQITTGDPVTVILDGTPDPRRGRIEWIASEAEFTPKTVYTEDTRVSLTYGARVRIPNPEGKLKIGMPVTLQLEEDAQ